VEPAILGIHHVTAICGDAQRNLDFYTGVLGLRLVKLTVNFDDPASYHLYYGDGIGSPGSILTFFPHPEGRPGRIGTGQAIVTSFSIPIGSGGHWEQRLAKCQVEFAAAVGENGEKQLRFVDPDGMSLELVESEGFPSEPWAKGGVPLAFAIRGILGVTLCEEGLDLTVALLNDMGSDVIFERAEHVRMSIGSSRVDLMCRPDAPSGAGGRGTIHHVAWRTPSDAHQMAWKNALAASRFNVSAVMDRQYFHSIYFREPGGVLFEIATDPPGFTVDEPLDALGTGLKLPPMYEPMRSQIEPLLKPLKLPHTK
jgi:catechol 2,3-dioxygenase-like lactoylglutathione lyase family enzyme